MKIVLAPNSFKGSLTARGAARAMASGLRRVLPEAELVIAPVADGGDGLVEIAVEILGGRLVKEEVQGPRFQPVTAAIAHIPERKLAVVEMALASGLTLVNHDQLDPEATTTYGTGQLMKKALDLGVEELLIGIGGSCTNDGGIGMGAALGMRFLDKAGRELLPVGGSLNEIAAIDTGRLDPRLRRTVIKVACDVTNPLTGPQGAAQVFGPQKGASPEQVQRLDLGLTNLAHRIHRDLGQNVLHLAGGGGAGGLGAGLAAFCGASLHRGTELVLAMVGLEEKIEDADLVLTGEGQIDFQTAFGKAPAGVARAAKARGVPCIGIAGSVSRDLGDLHAIGFSALFSLCPGPLPLSEAMANCGVYLADSAEQALRCFLAGTRRLSGNSNFRSDRGEIGKIAGGI